MLHSWESGYIIKLQTTSAISVLRWIYYNLSMNLHFVLRRFKAARDKSMQLRLIRKVPNMATYSTCVFPKHPLLLLFMTYISIWKSFMKKSLIHTHVFEQFEMLDIRIRFLQTLFYLRLQLVLSQYGRLSTFIDFIYFIACASFLWMFFMWRQENKQYIKKEREKN